MLNSVLPYINSHLSEEISLESLAKVTGYSPYHLHRMLREELREPIGAFILKQRMQAAAYLLCLTSLPVSEIGMLVGYESDSAFGRAFKGTMGAAPGAFRKEKNVQAKDLAHSSFTSLRCETVRLPDRQAIVFPTIGNYFSRDIYRVWDEVGGFLRREGLSADDFTFWGVLHDCQNVNPESPCRYDAAIVPKERTGKGIHTQSRADLPGGKFARYRFCSQVEEYSQIGSRINGHLLHEAKLEHAHGISYFRFDKLPCYEKADHLFIDWFIPIT